MFDGFETFEIATSGTTIHGRRGGQGPPVLLLHGMPETHLMWHRVAPRLAERHTVVATDLRGYGGSGTLWSRSGAVAAWYDPLEVWRAWADDVRGGPVAAGHFLPEEAPEETIRQLTTFLQCQRRPTPARPGGSVDPKPHAVWSGDGR